MSTSAAASNLNEARRNLEACLSEPLKKEYFSLLRQWFLIKTPITKEEFDKAVRKILDSEEQIRCHHHFLFAILAKAQAAIKPKVERAPTENKGVFESADFNEYVPVSSPSTILPASYEIRSAATELFMPDKGHMSCRIAVVAWQNGMDGAEENVTDLVVHSCQVFARNIITAMITRLKGYKIRNNKFQFGFNAPIPDPFLRNFNNVTDETQECKILVEDDYLLPKCKPSLERMEQEVAFAYSCSKKKTSENTLSLKLLYDTLNGNPKLLGLHTIHSLNFLKLGLMLDDENAELETEQGPSDAEYSQYSY